MKPEVSKSLNNMAVTYVREKRFQEAFKWFDELIKWDNKTGNELGVAITLYNMALIYHQHLGMDEKAEECLGKAMKIFKETGNEDYIQRIQKNMRKD
jgi:pentatricopeptide repeat protein